MKRVAVSCLLSVLFLPSLSWAEGLTFSGNIAVTSNSLSDGLSETDNHPALQFGAEMGNNGFYTGIFASQVRDDSNNRASLDVSVGYRAELAASLGYDFGITQSFRNQTGKDGTELYGSFSYPVSDHVTLTAEATYDVVEATFGGNLGAEYVPTDGWTVTAAVGKTDPSASAFWGLGVTHDLTPTTSVAFDYQDTATTDGVFALTLDYKFGQGGE